MLTLGAGGGVMLHRLLKKGPKPVQTAKPDTTNAFYNPPPEPPTPAETAVQLRAEANPSNQLGYFSPTSDSIRADYARAKEDITPENVQRLLAASVVPNSGAVSPQMLDDKRVPALNTITEIYPGANVMARDAINASRLADVGSHMPGYELNSAGNLVNTSVPDFAKGVTRDTIGVTTGMSAAYATAAKLARLNARLRALRIASKAVGGVSTIPINIARIASKGLQLPSNFIGAYLAGSPHIWDKLQAAAGGPLSGETSPHASLFNSARTYLPMYAGGMGLKAKPLAWLASKFPAVPWLTNLAGGAAGATATVNPAVAFLSKWFAPVGLAAQATNTWRTFKHAPPGFEKGDWLENAQNWGKHLSENAPTNGKFSFENWIRAILNPVAFGSQASDTVSSTVKATRDAAQSQRDFSAMQPVALRHIRNSALPEAAKAEAVKKLVQPMYNVTLAERKKNWWGSSYGRPQQSMVTAEMRNSMEQQARSRGDNFRAYLVDR